MSEWISVEDELPECNMKPNSFGVQVLVWPHVEENKRVDLYYGCRVTDEPNFYMYGRVCHGVTHWQPLLKPPE